LPPVFEIVVTLLLPLSPLLIIIVPEQCGVGGVVVGVMVGVGVTVGVTVGVIVGVIVGVGVMGGVMVGVIVGVGVGEIKVKAVEKVLLSAFA